MRAAIVALALCALALASSDSVYTSHFSGRSGDVFVRPAEQSAAECSLIQLSGASAFQGAAIEDVRVADLFAHVIGSPAVSSSSHADYSPLNLFSRPKALALFFVDGVSPATAATELPFVAGHDAVDVTATSYPQTSAVSRITTLLSGASPSVHGIVASEWPAADGRVVSAYGTDGKPAGGYNLPQAVESAFEGRSLAVSVSASYQQSAALVPSAHTKGHRVWAWYEDGAAAAADTCSDIAVTRDEVVAAIAADAELAATFSGDVAADRVFVAELMLVDRVTARLSTAEMQALLADGAPDVIAVAFSSLPALEAAHGASSKQLATARRLVSAASARLLTAVSVATGQRVAAAALVFRVSASVPVDSSALPLALVDELSSYAITGWARFLPAIYLTEAARRDVLSCSHLNSLAAGSAVVVDCGPRSFSSVHYRAMYARDALLFGNESNQTNHTGRGNHTRAPLTEEEISRFQMALWVGIILSCTVFVAVWFIFFMRYTDDRLVFKHEPWMKNPWE